jgi:predicted kinase
MEAILLVGIQGSGKSTFYCQAFFDTHLRISLDQLRTRQREQRLLEFCLETRQPFVVDKTNVTREERARYIEAARAAGFQVAGFFFLPDPQGAFQRNQQRERRVPPAGLFGTLKRLQPPVLAEGFDRLDQVVVASGGGFAVSGWVP